MYLDVRAPQAAAQGAALVRHRHRTCAHWAKDLIESFGLPPCSPAAIRLHQDGDESAAALFATMSSATRRLDICTYILGNDAFGRKAMQHMMERARSGVEVQAADRRRRRDAIAAGRASMRCSRAASRPRFSVRCSHARPRARATCAITEKWSSPTAARLWAGGTQPCRRIFLGLNGAPPWRDLTFDLQGAVAAAAAAQFEADWVAAGGRPGRDGRWRRASRGPAGGRRRAAPSFCRAVRTRRRIRCTPC